MENKSISAHTLLNKVEIMKNLNTETIGKNIICLDITDSTNEEAKRLGNAGAEDGLVIFAEEQTKGKGRMGRSWVSPKYIGIWFSVLLRPNILPSNIANITLVAGYSVCKAIRNFTGCNAMIKWPNDIIIDNKKICGILTEMTVKADKVNYIVVGIGINVNTQDFPQEISCKATSLFLQKGEKINRINLIKEILRQFDKDYKEYLISNSLEMISEFKEYCATIGREITAFIGNKTVKGVAVDISSIGELLIKTDDGDTVNVNSGEVTVQGIY